MPDTIFALDFMDRGATLSPCRRYRYDLWRAWGPGAFHDRDRSRLVNFVMLNPSIADSMIDDPTVRRCVRFAKDWGYAGLVVTNLFAYRATDPRELATAPDPVGPENDRALLEWAGAAGLVVCAWGNHGGERSRAVSAMLRDAGARLHALKVTGPGQPSHPVRLPASLVPQPWEPAHVQAS